LGPSSDIEIIAARPKNTRWQKKHDEKHLSLPPTGLASVFCPKDHDGAIGRIQACRGLCGMSGNFTVCKALQKKKKPTERSKAQGRFLEVPVYKTDDLKNRLFGDFSNPEKL
jgi:hypothetical protein